MASDIIHDPHKKVLCSFFLTEKVIHHQGQEQLENTEKCKEENMIADKFHFLKMK
jgi:hypothetical protein